MPIAIILANVKTRHSGDSAIHNEIFRVNRHFELHKRRLMKKESKIQQLSGYIHIFVFV